MKYEYSEKQISKLFTDWYGQSDNLIGATITDDDGKWIIREALSDGNYRLESEDGKKSINVTLESLKKFI